MAKPSKKTNAKVSNAKAIESKPRRPLEGRWRIVWMGQWDVDYGDEETEADFEFGPNNSGSFQFGCVEGDVDYRVGVRDGKPCVEFSWDGHDESEAAQGRGWAIFEKDRMEGTIFFHQGDESEFKAKKSKRK